MADEVDLDLRFRAAPQAAIDRPAFRVAWPHGGLPVALDRAAAAMLDCFSDPLSARELAEDLVVALGLSPHEAQRSAGSIVASLLNSGHVIPEGLEPMPATRLGYPPSASP